MNPAPNPRRASLRALAAEGDEAAAHDLFLEYGETLAPDPDTDFPPPSGDAGGTKNGNASNRKGN